MTRPLRLACAALLACACGAPSVRPSSPPAQKAAKPLTVYVAAFKDRSSSLTSGTVVEAPAAQSDAADLLRTVPEAVGEYLTVSPHFSPTPDPAHCDLMLIGVIQSAVAGRLAVNFRFVSCATQAPVAEFKADVPYAWRFGLQRANTEKLVGALNALAAKL